MHAPKTINIYISLYIYVCFKHDTIISLNTASYIIDYISRENTLQRPLELSAFSISLYV